MSADSSSATHGNLHKQADMHETVDLSRNPTTGPARFIKKPQPKILYPDTMLRDAVRGELVYTPDLKPMMDSIARDMRLTPQPVGRHLGSNTHYSKMKSILKQGQRAMATLDRYLVSEAFIRTDIWNTAPLQEFFKLVHLHGLEREFRDEYWEKNQQAHPAKIQKLYESIKRPLTNRLDGALADEITNLAKDIMSRSVYVPRADHPIIRSAVAIMNMAEQQPDKLQESPRRIAQIWAAWCLARDKHWAEATYLAVIILARAGKNQLMAKCFRHENSALLRLAGRCYDEEACRRWQDMHGKCHVIPVPELLSRPVVASLPHASPSSGSLRKTSSSASQLQKTSRMVKRTGTKLAKVVPSKVKELDSSSKHQLSPIRPSTGQHIPLNRSLNAADLISRRRTPEDIAQDLQIHDLSYPKKDHNEGIKKQRLSEHNENPVHHPELYQPQVKRRKITASLRPIITTSSRPQPDIRHGTTPATPAGSMPPATPVGSTTPITAAEPLIPSMAPLDMVSIPVATMPASTPMATVSAPTSMSTMSAPPPTPANSFPEWENQMANANDIATLVAMKLCGRPSGLPFTGQPVATKAEHESTEETWTKLEARLEKKLSPFLRQLEGLSSELEARGDKQAALEKTIAKHANDQHDSQGKQFTHNETLMERVETLTKLLEDQQTALDQAVTKVDSLSQLVQTLQKDQEELKIRVDRGQKKRGRFSANDKIADSITCAPLS
ncbi:hypothetical protein LY76DRAFT_623978 [Colletotrichum caudatum]|nr:hypothetical protein LY76DRAFT_623978 [Colletotrichum caudatum]